MTPTEDQINKAAEVLYDRSPVKWCDDTKQGEERALSWNKLSYDQAAQYLETAKAMFAAALPRIEVSPEDAVAFTGRTRTRVFEAIKNKELLARKDGKATLIEIEELARWVMSMPNKVN